MGIVQKQAVRVNLINYLGFPIGYINIILLYQNYFETAEFGLISIFEKLSIFYMVTAMFGLHSVIFKYFPFFKTEDKKHNGFAGYIFLWTVAGGLISLVALFLLKPIIIDVYQENSPLVVEYFNYLAPLCIFMLAYNVLEMMTRAVFRSVMPNLIREVFKRLIITVFLIFKALDWIDFHTFFLCYLGTHLFIAFLLLAYLVYHKDYKLNFNFSAINRSYGAGILKFAGFSYLAGTTFILIQSIDTFMLGAMVGLSDVGVYTMAFSFGALVTTPARALGNISIPLVAEAWKEKDLAKISDLYKRTALIQMAVGLLLFIGIWVNKENLFHILKPEYKEGFSVIILICLAQWIDTATGMNATILATSEKYRFDLYFNLVLVAISIVLNYLLIPVFDIEGAALATLISISFFNFLKWIFLKKVFGFQPFDKGNLMLLIIGIPVWAIGYFLPWMGSIWVDIPVRSVSTALLFCIPLYYLKTIPDVNAWVDKILGKFNLRMP